MDGAPGYWMNETSGVLREAVKAYLERDELTGEEIAALRAYFRQWVGSPLFVGKDIEALRREVSGLMSRPAIEARYERRRRIGGDAARGHASHAPAPSRNDVLEMRRDGWRLSVRPAGAESAPGGQGGLRPVRLIAQESRDSFDVGEA